MKTIAIICDTWKVTKFRQRFIQEGYTFVFDSPGPVEGSHTFKVEVSEKDFENEKAKMGKILKNLDIELKYSN